jgi:predicted nuclease of restriction endonuclease-like (RecB) superfamily
MMNSPIPANYEQFFNQLKTRIQTAQVQAALAVNRELILLYWQIGREILQQQEQQGWGAKVIDRLATDLKKAFPEVKGFSARNLRYMRAFADAYPDEQTVQQLVAQIPWGHNVRLLDMIGDPQERQWYIQQTIQQGWSRNVLIHQVESGLYYRQGRAPNNFERTLPTAQSELAQQLLKDPYQFDFLTVGDKAQERDIEQALLRSVSEFLLELGVGFALVGNQYRIDVGGEDFYIDLLFYHLKLRCYVVIDLKISKFEPEFAGKMNFYLAAVDELLRHPDDQPSIGIILCKSKNKTIVEYALRDAQKPIGVAEYHLTRSLPEPLQNQLPSTDALAAELQQMGNRWNADETVDDTP